LIGSTTPRSSNWVGVLPVMTDQIDLTICAPVSSHDPRTAG
jgi:hypothetical protein